VRLRYFMHKGILKLWIALCRGGHFNNQNRLAKQFPLPGIAEILKSDYDHPKILRIKSLLLKLVRVGFVEGSHAAPELKRRAAIFRAFAKGTAIENRSLLFREVGVCLRLCAFSLFLTLTFSVSDLAVTPVDL